MKIEWSGGENPVKPGQTLTRVWLDNGEVKHTDDGGGGWDWSSDNGEWNIIAYEVTPDRVESPTETLRDRVAMAALTGLLSGTLDGDGFCKVNIHQVAQSSLAIADAFMAARGDA